MINLEVGKTYEVRNPKRSKLKNYPITAKIIEDRGEGHYWRYRSEGGEVYNENGGYYRSGSSDFDLVKEITE